MKIIKIVQVQIYLLMIERNIFYEIKKQANKRSSPYLNPNTEDDDLRKQNRQLRTKIRSQQTQIIRLNAKVQELSEKITLSQTTTKQTNSQQTQSVVNTFSKLPMLMENKQLKQNNQILHQQHLMLNGKNNELQAELRQIKSDKYQLQLKVKELNILQNMRAQRFKDQLQRLTPVVIQQPSEFTAIKEAVTYLTKFIRQRIFQVTYNIFISSAKQCEGKKKVNSFTIFTNYWNQIKKQKSYGFAAVTSSYKALVKVMKIIDQNYAQIDYEEEKGTLNEWVFESMVQIKNTLVIKQKQRKLFRMLGLAYRSKYPIKGQKFEMTESVRNYLQNAICFEALKLLLEEN